MVSINNHSLEGVRALVIRHLCDLGAPRNEVGQLDELELHDGPERVAVRFRAGHFIALWNLPARSIVFYDDQACHLGSLPTW